VSSRYLQFVRSFPESVARKLAAVLFLWLMPNSMSQTDTVLQQQHLPQPTYSICINAESSSASTRYGTELYEKAIVSMHGHVNTNRHSVRMAPSPVRWTSVEALEGPESSCISANGSYTLFTNAIHLPLCLPSRGGDSKQCSTRYNIPCSTALRTCRCGDGERRTAE
jgi:hypothetical protein